MRASLSVALAAVLLLAGKVAAAPPDAVLPLERAPAGAPNVVLVLLDDVGFAAAGTFGGPVATPALDALARDGLRYNRFHTTAICSPTRAALLSGHNPHAVGIGAVMNSADERPGYRGVSSPQTANVAEILRQNGYSTAMFGKWHQAPDWEISQSGPFDRWPTGAGFERFYGFFGGETNQFEPTLIDGTRPVLRPPGPHYHLTTDLADHAIAWMRAQHAQTPGRPFFLYFAPGATHAPLQAPAEWIARHRGRFDQGWDRLREESLARQKALGVVPADTVLTPRPDGLPAWESLGADDRRIAARLMETYAGFLAHTDAEVGRLVADLKQRGQFDNTLFIYIVGDNGASGEGGIDGSLNYMGAIQGIAEDRAAMLKRLDEIGGPTTYAHYNAGWAWGLNAPFQWTKTVASHFGGTRNPMVLAWPKRIADRGGLRSQFGHVNDIVPTVLEAAGIAAPAIVNGVAQRRMDGTSLLYSFADAAAPERHTTQYFEIYGNRALYHEGWIAAAFHGRLPWARGIRTEARPFEVDRWELYDTRRDFSGAHDLAVAEPEKLRQLQALFLKEAERNQVLPLAGASLASGRLPNLSRGRTEFLFYPGMVGMPENQAPAMVNRSWTLDAAIDNESGHAGGVIASIGGSDAGWSLFVTGDGRAAFTYRLFDLQELQLLDPKRLPPGRHSVAVDYAYDGGGYGMGATVRLKVDGRTVAEGRLQAGPPAFFSINETFDIGIDTGAAAGRYPDAAAPGFPFDAGRIEQVAVHLH